MQLLDILGKRRRRLKRCLRCGAQLCIGLRSLKARARDFETIAAVTHAIADAGAPVWAKRLREEKVAGGRPAAANCMARRLGSRGS